jgi:hypothetical protein
MHYRVMAGFASGRIVLCTKKLISYFLKLTFTEKLAQLIGRATEADIPVLITLAVSKTICCTSVKSSAQANLVCVAAHFQPLGNWCKTPNELALATNDESYSSFMRDLF